MPVTNVAYRENKILTKPDTQKQNFASAKPLQHKADQVSFGSGSLISVLSKLEGNPVLALATIDFLGMIVPRTWIDLNRNKQELGHLNWDAGREAFMREVFSSSVLFFGPGLIYTAIGNKLLNSKFNPHGVNTKAMMNYTTLNAVEKKVQDILRTEALKGTKSLPVHELRQRVARSLLEDVRAYSSSAANPLKLSSGLIDDVVKFIGDSSGKVNIDKAVRRFARVQLKDEYLKAFKAAEEKLLADATAKGIENVSKQALRREAAKMAKETMATVTRQTEGAIKSTLLAARERGTTEFIAKFLPKAAEHLKETEAILSIPGAKPIESGLGTIMRDLFTTTDDIIMKAANGAEKVSVDKMRSGVDKIVKSTRTLKIAKVVVPIIAIFAALVTFPKFSAWLTTKLNGGKSEFPGLAGISGEKEDKVSFSSNKKEENKTQNTAQQSTATGQQAVPAMPELPPVSKPVTKNPYAMNIFADFERRAGR